MNRVNPHRTANFTGTQPGNPVRATHVTGVAHGNRATDFDDNGRLRSILVAHYIASDCNHISEVGHGSPRNKCRNRPTGDACAKPIPSTVPA